MRMPQPPALPQLAERTGDGHAHNVLPTAGTEKLRTKSGDQRDRATSGRCTTRDRPIAETGPAGGHSSAGGYEPADLQSLVQADSDPAQ